MVRQRVVVMAGVSALFLMASGSHNVALSVSPARTLTSPTPSSLTPAACALLTIAEVSAALEVASLAGQPAMGSDPASCIWSDDASHGIGNRRVTLTIISAVGYDVGKAGNSRMTIVPAGGLGDDAYYAVMIRTSESPSLSVRKGSTTFRVRILNGLKFTAFSLDQEKAKEADLAKAAAGRL